MCTPRVHSYLKKSFLIVPCLFSSGRFFDARIVNYDIIFHRLVMYMFRGRRWLSWGIRSEIKSRLLKGKPLAVAGLICCLTGVLGNTYSNDDVCYISVYICYMPETCQLSFPELPRAGLLIFSIVQFGFSASRRFYEFIAPGRSYLR